MIEGKVQVGGQVAAMSINEKLLQAVMAKNPDLVSTGTIQTSGMTWNESVPQHASSVRRRW